MNSNSIHQPAPRRYTTLDGRINNALDKSRQLRREAVRLGEFTYKVCSQREGHNPHYVEVTEHGLLCDCESAQYNQPCFHAAAVARRLERERRPTTRRAFVYGTGELFDEDAPAKPRPSKPAPTPAPIPPFVFVLTLEEIFSQ